MAGCERFDSLVGKFSDRNVPAVGFAVGFDRTIVAMEELNLFPSVKTKTVTLVTIFSEAFLSISQKITQKLRSNGINTDLFPDPTTKLEKQLKYADKRGIPYVLILGEEEVKNNTVVVKNMKNKTQHSIPQKDLVLFFKKLLP